MSLGGYIISIFIAIIAGLYFYSKNGLTIEKNINIPIIEEKSTTDSFSEILNISWGYSSEQGRRPFMQDRISLRNNSIYFQFGVFDGHGDGINGDVN